MWPTPAAIQSVAGKIRIPNDTDYPIVGKRNEHLAQVSPVFNISTRKNISHSAPSKFDHPVKPTSNHRNVTIDPDNILPPTVVSSFKKINEEFNDVFRPDFKGYNEAVGPISVVVNMGPVEPPQRKGKLPQYSRKSFK